MGQMKFSLGFGIATLLLVGLLVPAATAPGPRPDWMVAIVSPPNLAEVQGLTPIVGISGLGDFNRDGFVVIGFIDTGINPYSWDFNMTYGQPNGDPAAYIPGYPSGTPAINLNCQANFNIPTVCASDFAGVVQNKMYRFPGTKIIGAISFGTGYTAPTYVLDDDGHGTKSISVSAGNIAGNCPQCLVVSIEGLGDAGLQWAKQQPWIDILSNSWGTQGNAGTPNGVCSGGSCATRDMAMEGSTVLFAAGNGYENAFVTPEPDYGSPYAGPDWHMIVGAALTSNNGSIIGSGKPVTVTGYGAGNIPSACVGERTITCQHSGTSAATPQVAGVLGAVLDEARLMMSDGNPNTLYSGYDYDGALGLGVAAWGKPLDGTSGTVYNQYLDDGKLTRQELWAIVLRTAGPLNPNPSPGPPATMGSSSADYSYTGYGLVTKYTRNAALNYLRCGTDLPKTPDKDAYLENDSRVRIVAWGNWTESLGKKAGTAPVLVGNESISVCQPQPPLTPPSGKVTLTVSGLAVPGSATPVGPNGDWSIPVNFDNYPTIAGLYPVVAKYGPVNDTKYYRPPGWTRPADAENPPYPKVCLGGPYDTQPNTPVAVMSCVSSGTPPYTCEWRGGSFEASNCSGTMASFTRPGNYIVTLRAIDSTGRYAEARTVVRVGASNTDTDLDGLSDFADNCPATPNQDQADRDFDGLGDACDDDPDVSVYTSPDGKRIAKVPGNDADADGFLDGSDNCPMVPNSAQTDLDGDLLGDACDDDLDSDGVVNGMDNCPMDPNLRQGDVDLDGKGDPCGIAGAQRDGASAIEGAPATGFEFDLAASMMPLAGSFLLMAAVVGTSAYFIARRHKEGDK